MRSRIFAKSLKKLWSHLKTPIYSKVVQFGFGALRLWSREHCPALPLSSHFCSKTGLRLHCPRISAAKLACVGTAPAFPQQHCPPSPLSSRFCGKTALRCHGPLISEAKLPCVTTALASLQHHCPALPLPCASTVLHGLRAA